MLFILFFQTRFIKIILSCLQLECEKILAEFLDDVSTVIRDITVVPSAHDCLFSPGRMASSACQDYFLFIGRLSSTANGVNALEKAGIFQEYIKSKFIMEPFSVMLNFFLVFYSRSLLELVAGTNHDCYLKVIVSMLDYHTDGYSRFAHLINFTTVPHTTEFTSF